jgi:hypothetical protein
MQRYRRPQNTAEPLLMERAQQHAVPLTARGCRVLLRDH